MELKLGAVAHIANTSKIEDGVWVEVTNTDGDPIVHPKDKKKTLKAKVRSSRSSKVRKLSLHNQVSSQSTVSRTKKRDQKDVIVKTATQNAQKEFAVLLLGIDGFDMDDPSRVQDLTEDDAAAIYEMSNMQWFVDWVIATSNDDKLYGLEPETDPVGNAGAGELRQDA